MTHANEAVKMLNGFEAMVKSGQSGNPIVECAGRSAIKGQAYVFDKNLRPPFFLEKLKRYIHDPGLL